MLAKELSETVEFFTPQKGFDVAAYLAENDIQSIHHVARYQWACMALAQRKPRVVVDIACGAGYGSYMLAKALPDATIVGADYDARAVEYARSQYKLPNLSYMTGDLITGTLNGAPLRGIDALISFDTIEHLPHRDLALVRMADALFDDGRLLLSTPSAHVTSVLDPNWEHHEIEYSDADLFSVLSRFFSRILRETWGSPQTISGLNSTPRRLVTRIS
jgi:2-polyprenyl-3-methyl-5-hydroxy-6-metoxy-1,4-benzoquinol methylase